MKKKVLMSVAVSAAFLIAPVVALADTVGPITFESYSLGNINGQDGWIKTGPFDAAVSNTSIPTSFGTQSLRMSDSVTSGSFGDQTFSKPLTDEAGESSALNGGMSGGVRQNHFEAQFDIASVLPDLQTGMHLSVSPDRGDGARMSYLRFEDKADGIHVYFDDVQGVNVGYQAANFVETDIATISRAPHTIKFVMDFVEGQSNDIVKIYIDSALVHTGTSWENYYRFDTESQGYPAVDPSLYNKSRTVDSLLFRESGTAAPADAGKGFLIDNLTLSSSTLPPAMCPAGTTQAASPIETVVVNSSASTPVLSSSILANGQSYILMSSGTWQNTNLNAADTAYASVDSWTTHMQGYDITPYFLGTGEFQLQLGGNFVNWGSYNPAHTYSYLYTGTGSAIGLGVFDGNSNTNTPNAGWYGDNTGSLSVAIYPCNPVVIPPTTVTVTIDKFIDGVQATASSANNSAFPMSATWNAANIGTGSGSYDLDADGFNGDPTPYQAITAPMNSGADYTTNEVTGGATVGASCSDGKPYALVGYSSGNDLAAAQAAPKSTAAPNFTGLTGDKYVIVWNQTCPPPPPALSCPAGTTRSASPMEIITVPATQDTDLFSTNPLALGTSYILKAYGTADAGDGITFDARYSFRTSTSAAWTDAVSTYESYGPTLLDLFYNGTTPWGTYNSSHKYEYLTTGNGSPAAFHIYDTYPSNNAGNLKVDIYSCDPPTPTTGTISGMKYNDLNRNGKKDVNEPGLQGWTIKLENEATDAVIATTVTDADGNYTFTNILPGTYEVREKHQKGWKRMSKNPKDIVIAAGDVVTGVNFGNAQKKKGEREDTDKDDNHDDQHGAYYGNHSHSDYDKDQDNRDHDR